MRKRSSSSAAAAEGVLKRGPWTADEDELLARCIRSEGEGRWRTLPKRAGLLRCGKSCRLRWMNYLRPDVKRGRIAPDEEDLIVRLHRLLGNRWSLIAGRIPGRTDNEIKNYWNTHLSKKLISQGIDPRTHKPLDSINPKPQVQPPTPNPNPNPNPLYTSGDFSGGEGEGVLLQDEENNHYFNNTTMDYTAVLGSQRSDIGGGDNEDEDIFSSFLNSLINEDNFLHQEDENNNKDDSVQPARLDAPIPSAMVFGHGDWWEASLSSPAALDHDVTGN